MVATTEQGRFEESHLILKMLLALLARLRRSLQTKDRFLDIGCGHGALVKILRDRGIDAFGADFFPNPLGIPEPTEEKRNYLRSISMLPYRLPFESNSFDLVYSNQVLEHVADLETTLWEVRRVMKSGGLAVHIYPATWRVLESHIRVPFAGGIQSRRWIAAWTLLGLGTCPAGLSTRRAAAHNYRYLREQTFYRSVNAVQRTAEKIFSKIRWAEADYLLSATGRAKIAGRTGPVLPLTAFLYRHFVARVLILEK